MSLELAKFPCDKLGSCCNACLRALVSLLATAQFGSVPDRSMSSGTWLQCNWLPSSLHYHFEDKTDNDDIQCVEYVPSNFGFTIFQAARRHRDDVVDAIDEAEDLSAWQK